MLICNSPLLRLSTSCRASSSLRALSTVATKFSDRVLLHVDDKDIAHVTLNRPEKLNALDMDMFHAIQDTIHQLSSSSSASKSSKKIRAVILSGAGRSFCAGLDVQAVAKGAMDSKALLERKHGHDNFAQSIAYGWRKLSVPVICVIHGTCFGGGLQVALGCDFRIASPTAQISIRESVWGLVPDMSASVTLRELIPIDVAKELTMTGRIISGVEAKELGLVTRLAEDPAKEAQLLTHEILKRSPDAVASAKELFQKTWVAPEEECLSVESELQKKLLWSWNQMAATAKQLGFPVPYIQKRE